MHNKPSIYSTFEFNSINFEFNLISESKIYETIFHIKEKNESYILIFNTNNSIFPFLDFLNAKHVTRIGMITNQFNYDDNIKYKSYENIECVSILGIQAFYGHNNMDAFKNSTHLGKVKENILTAEPRLRNTNTLFIDLNSIKKSDAPAKRDSSPIGFTAEEICSLAYFFGNGELGSDIVFYNWDDNTPSLDKITTGLLIENIVFYFQQGKSKRSISNLENEANLVQYQMEINDQNLIFIKNELSNKWWIKLNGKKIPCLYEDYKKTSEGNFPEFLWDLI